MCWRGRPTNSSWALSESPSSGNVPTLVIGVTIVGFGTSAPELLVSALAAADGEAEIAIGNIVGSNVANMTLLLGLGAVIVPLGVDSRTVRREAPLVAGAALLFAIFVQGGGIGRIEGAGLLVAMIAALALVVRRATGDPLASQAVDLTESAQYRLGTEVGRTIVGLAGTVGAARLLLWGALEIAHRANLSEGFIGVTLVAVGTSLPELVTIVQSARRLETDLIVGNLLGSTLFNTLMVGGVIGLIGPPAIDAPSLTTLAALAVVATAFVALIAMVSAHTVSRKEGAALIAAYLVLVPFLA